MRARGVLIVPLAIWLATATFAACESGVSSTGTGGGGSGPASSSASASSTGGSAGAGPIECNATYSTIPIGDCDVLQQDCPLGYTCKPALSGGDYVTKCVPSNGLKTVGEPCYGDGECEAKLFCVGGLLDSKCAAVCCDSIKDFCNGGTCNYNLGFGNNYYMTICRYATECKLLTENACEPGLDCHVEDKQQGLATCGSKSPQPVGELETCHFLNDCGDMQDCFTTSPSGGTCYYYCFLSETGLPVGLGGCPVGEICVDKIGTVAVDFNIPDIGLCIPDPNAPPPDAGSGTGTGGSGGAGGTGGVGGTGGAGVGGAAVGGAGIGGSDGG